MKLYTEMRNDRGGKKGTSDDTRILVELSHKNKIIGTVGLYSIGENGYRVVWDDGKGYNPNRPPLAEFEGTR